MSLQPKIESVTVEFSAGDRVKCRAKLSEDGSMPPAVLFVVTVDGQEFYKWRVSTYMLSSKSSAGLFQEFKRFLKDPSFALSERLK